jgi:hypothetical protein
LLTRSSDGTARIWNAASGQPIAVAWAILETPLRFDGNERHGRLFSFRPPDRVLLWGVTPLKADVLSLAEHGKALTLCPLDKDERERFALDDPFLPGSASVRNDAERHACGIWP